MSQKKLKKLRKIENVDLVKKTVSEPVFGIRKIIKENWKFLLALCVGIFILYFNSLNGAFVSDDYATIPNNPLIMSFKDGASSFVGISNWFLAVSFGISSPIPFHTFSLFLYLIVCVLVFIFLYIVFDKKTAILSTILFAVLPIHVEAVSWISGKPYLFTSLTVLLTLIFFILYLKSGVKKYLWLFIVSLPIAFFAEKVRSLSIVFLISLFILTFKDTFKVKINFKKIFLFCFLGMLISAIILWPQINNRITSVNGGYNGNGSIFYNPFFQYPTAIAKYLQVVFVPTDLTLYHTMYIIPVWFNWAIILLFLGNIVYFWFKDKNIFFALMFIFLATAPSMAPVKVSWLVAERYMILGSLGFCVLLVLFFKRFSKKWELPFLIMFILLIGTYSVRVFYRNIDWQTNHKLWVNTCQVSPNSHNAWNNIGDDYDKLKQYDNSVKGFTQSTVVKPDYADAYHNRANIFYKTGRLDLARDSYQTALKFSPGLVQTYYSLVQIDLTEKKYDLALQDATKAVQIQPSLQSYYILAVVNYQVGKKDEAIKILQQIVNTAPQFTQAKQALTQMLSEKK
ncbi:MAG: tetratricopeptide repeat protein [Candidatus Shapirobacteria bacterium]